MRDSSDIRHMRYALQLGERGLGRTWPNPSVGALVVAGDEVAGAATTARGGRPHAETQALKQAGGKAYGATLYVTLEPCAHEGKTPPCTDAIITAGIKRVVAACTDPNPEVSGKGFAALRRAKIEVIEGVCEAEARALNEGFFSVMERKRPFVMLKTATSLDGKIAGGSSKDKWITGEESRRMVHALRASYDAVITGIGTVLADDPELTCRLPGLEADSPQRVVMDGDLRIPLDAKILPAWIITSAQAMAKQQEKVNVLKDKGSLVFAVACASRKLSLTETLELLAREGVTRLMVEAGSALSGSFIDGNLVDRLYWFRAPITLGESAIPALKGQDILSLPSRPELHLRESQNFGEDVLEIYGLGAI
jgi:diaminohydroxyphosphoribosylaminopyrimidine deaminase/5-amino-6-(5-phosphoribosylamino)uracil reductase